MTSSNLLHTPFYDRIVALNARLTEFGGWTMPIQYGGLVQEHQAVRQTVGLFDISHMAKFVLRGAGVLEQLNRLVPTDLSGLEAGKAQYTVLLNESGGIIDDVIIYPQSRVPGEEVILVIANASTVAKDKAWLEAQLNLPSPTIVLEDWTLSHVLLALQGSQAEATLQPWVSEDLSQLPRFGHGEFTSRVGSDTLWIARTGYTGEDGFEIMTPPATGLALWDALLEAAVTPCGLGARDTLRLEAAMGLYGQDMDETTTPWEASLGWLVHLDRKGEFVGRSALVKQQQEGIPRRLVGVVMEGRHIARHDYPVIKQDQTVGIVTSGTWSPTLQKAIALAYVPPDCARIGETIAVEIRGKSCPGQVVKRPFYKRG